MLLDEMTKLMHSPNKPFKGFYECNECETGYDKGKGNYCLDIDECYTVGCDDYDEVLELLCTNTEGLKRLVSFKGEPFKS